MAPKLKTCAKGIVENIVGEPRLGTPTAWPSKECMRPRGAAARAGGGGTAAGAVNMAPKLKTCAKGIVDSIVGNRVRERQPGTAWPNAGARPGMSSGTPSGTSSGTSSHEPRSRAPRSGTSNVSREPGTPQKHRREPRVQANTAGNVAGNTCRYIVATTPGQQRSARAGNGCPVAVCSKQFAETLYLLLRSWSAPGNPVKACSSLSRQPCTPKILAKSLHFRSRRLCVLLENRRSCLDLVEPGSLVAW